MTYIEAVVVPLLILGLVIAVISGRSHKAHLRAQAASQTVPAADTVSPEPPPSLTEIDSIAERWGHSLVVRVTDPTYGVTCWVAKGTGIYCMRTP